MGTSDSIALVSVVIAALSLALAAWQHLGAKRTAESERERLARLSQRLRDGSRSASALAEAANLLVQQTKQSNADLTGIGSQARAIRGSLYVLADQLVDDSNQVLQVVRPSGFLSTAPKTTP